MTIPAAHNVDGITARGQENGKNRYPTVPYISSARRAARPSTPSLGRALATKGASLRHLFGVANHPLTAMCGGPAQDQRRWVYVESGLGTARPWIQFRRPPASSTNSAPFTTVTSSGIFNDRRRRS